MSFEFAPVEGPSALNFQDGINVCQKFGLIKVTNKESGGCQIFSKTYEDWAEKILDFPVRPDDIYVCTFPKAGTTWVQEMVWMITHNCDVKGAEEYLHIRSPWLDEGPTQFNGMCMSLGAEGEYNNETSESIDRLNEMKARRIIKCHLQYSFLPRDISEKKAKIIYVLRNPLDTCISFFHFLRIIYAYTGTFEEFAESFLDGNVMYGSYWQHVLSYWKMRNEENIIFIHYEDMRRDLRSVLKKVADFLGKELTVEKCDFLLDHLSFQKMKNNKAVNFDVIREIAKTRFNFQGFEGNFMRKGISGDWKDNMSPELAKRFTTWNEENMKDTELTINLE